MATNQRILVIDDDEMILRMVAYVFHKSGYQVYTAANGQEGLAKIQTAKPDLIILDVMMPDMSGLEVCQHVRSHPSTASLPILMLSAKGEVDDKVSGFEAGADDYVAKPVAPKELLARARALLARAKRAPAPLARTIGVVGVKGGVGVTTVAVNVATTLASQGLPVILAELRPHRGTAAHNLKMSPTQDLAALMAMEPDKIRHTDITRRLVSHSSGLRLLASPQRPTGHPLTAAHVNVILDALAQESAFLILDLPAVSGEASRLALERADQILLLTEPELLSVACARADIETLKEWGVLDRTGLVVVARTRSNMPITPAEVEEQLGLKLLAALPPAPELFQVVAAAGHPIVLARPQEIASVRLMKLAGVLAEAAGR